MLTRLGDIEFVKKSLIKIFSSGKVPKHIAIIMDGNRRFATKSNIKKLQGHTKGYQKLLETIELCKKFGLREVTVYAFSIENFNRSPEEVNTLMSLIKQKLIDLIEDGDIFMKNGVRFRVVGNWSLIPADLRTLIAKATIKTKDNTEMTLNVAFAYTSRDEMTTAIRDILEGVKEGLINKEDISEELIDQTLQISAPDLLIRTSGEVRLSDFMLWQTSNTCIYFTKVLWPEFKIWNVLAAIFYYQRNYQHKSLQYAELNERCLNFIHTLNEKRWRFIKQYSQE